MQMTSSGVDGDWRRTCESPGADSQRVAWVRERLVGVDEAGRMAAQFKLLADATRTRLLDALLAGELCVCDLAATIGVSESTVSHALRLLRTAGIVSNRRDGRMIYYSLADDHIRLLLEVSLEHLRHDQGSET